MSVPFTHIDKLYIDGAWTPTTGGFDDIINPATEAPIGRAPVGTMADTEAAIAAARHAFDTGPWPRMSIAERAQVMHKMHAALVARQPQIAALIIAEVGCAFGVTHMMQVAMPIEHLMGAIEQCVGDTTQHLPITTTPNFANPDGPKILGGTTVVREPVGVVAGITGYNFPFLLNLAKITPALLAGNTLVLKPAPQTPFSALLFGEIADEIGLPKGVLNIITGGPEVGGLLSSHDDIDLVTFTGSEQVGALIMRQAAPTLKRVHLELGGKSPYIVRHDADVMLAAQRAVGFLTVNAGQGCAIPTRLIVHNAVRAQFVAAAVAVAGHFKIGEGSDPSVMMGPLISAMQRQKVETLIAKARDEGATLVHGGGRPADLSKGWFTDVTLFDNVDNASTIAQEEVFGPVGAIIGFDSDDDAVSIANASRYGLAGAIDSADAATAWDMANKLRTGSVAINGGTGKMAFAPIGGYKRSGVGREYGPDWLREFQEEKSLFYPIGR